MDLNLSKWKISIASKNNNYSISFFLISRPQAPQLIY